MRGRLPLLALIAGGVAYALRNRRARARVEAAPDERAEELRRKLAEARDLDSEREEFEGAETPVDHAQAPGPDERRREVHERGRAAADEMRGGSG